jgi:protein-tyrosine-phosphatase
MGVVALPRGLRELVDSTHVLIYRVLRTVLRMLRRAPDRFVHPLRLRAAVRRLRRRPPPQHVLVVCHGNICRSPYAAALLRDGLRALVGDGVRVASAGFVLPGRSCPALAVEVAATRGLDLSGHRSQLLVPPEVATADLILVMDTTQRWGVRALFGRTSEDVLLLGDLDPGPIETREIRDPFDQPREVFEESYSRIERCVAEFIRAVSVSVHGHTFRGFPPQSPRDQDGEQSARQQQTA